MANYTPHHLQLLNVNAFKPTFLEKKKQPPLMLDGEAPMIIGLLEVLHTTLATMLLKGINKLLQFLLEKY
jgi:hypothetical protein